MMAANYIIDVSEDSFEVEVVNYSLKSPVVLDFWAPWAVPCRVQSALLAQIAMEGQGSFRLARVNVEEQPKLAERLRINHVPSIKAFVDGSIVAEYAGVLAEPHLRRFIDRIMPQGSSLMLEKGISLLGLGDIEGAIQTLEDYRQRDPLNPAALYALARAHLQVGKPELALEIIQNFPASPLYSRIQSLRVLATALLESQSEKAAAESPLDAAYQRGLNLVMKGNIFAGLDGFLDILKRDKRYLDGQLHAIYLALLEVLGDENPEVRQYRSDLAKAIF
ncbi:MAG: tetratricopeptide repeat protein [Anaerolineaceae bacterium]|jgi:putative thioredoxin